MENINTLKSAITILTGYYRNVDGYSVNVLKC